MPHVLVDLAHLITQPDYIDTANLIEQNKCLIFKNPLPVDNP
jgi:hypothetical protein